MATLTAYEEQRLKNIERNRQLLADFDINKARDDLLEIPTTPMPSAVKIKKDTKTRTPIAKRKKPVVQRPQRKSSRLRGIEAPAIELNADDQIETTSNDDQQQALDENTTDSIDEFWDGKLIKPDDYFDQATREKAIRTNGRFTGWVNPELIQKYQFELSAQEAWEKNGGGKFSYKDPLGTGTKRKPARNSARAIAQMMFKKNPNMYFYRHNEPGVEQWTGDWTEEEKDLFMKIAREHGCGDKWGLFASYIPHRVGYQCSNYYRSVILPTGMVFDDNYEYTPSGKPFYVGSHRPRSS
ncbi:uncharacterized protein BX664DRAFT_324516 [Halteromyces radiatus]|uniref:uncharacterized protein n=1 Tax=Halteromyces radiatus TaxID=101107 RepID=UPI00221E880B|nr:uncharacterized protein BX664DRAFT_324516 [Halteromyces radiatus]KAI8096639.1 hypothetical protein BX664DRAFT_324516 [Halteromyces radiatus]